MSMNTFTKRPRITYGNQIHYTSLCRYGARIAGAASLRMRNAHTRAILTFRRPRDSPGETRTISIRPLSVFSRRRQTEMKSRGGEAERIRGTILDRDNGGGGFVKVGIAYFIMKIESVFLKYYDQ